MNRVQVNLFQGCAGDRNERGIQGARVMSEALRAVFGGTVLVSGTQRPILASGWEAQLEAAREDLGRFGSILEQQFREGVLPVSAFGRCACALATLPVVACHKPDATIVWFDAHGDANTPSTTTTGYLGGLVLTGTAGLWSTGLGDGLRLRNVILAGARDLDASELDMIERKVLRLVAPGPSFGQRLYECIQGMPVYIHIDCDVLDPGIVPTEYLVNGGLSLADLHEAAEALAVSELVGLEIAEFEARWAHNGKLASASPLINALQPLLGAICRQAERLELVSSLAKS